MYKRQDEGSAALIHGLTLAGVLLDEAALMPRSFVEQAVARCSVEGSRVWFSCNPEGPGHWFFREWIARREEKRALYLHFTMWDNPSLSRETILRYQRQFRGSFYRRFVLGAVSYTHLGRVCPFAHKMSTPPPEEFCTNMDLCLVVPMPPVFRREHSITNPIC